MRPFINAKRKSMIKASGSIFSSHCLCCCGVQAEKNVPCDRIPALNDLNDTLGDAGLWQYSLMNDIDDDCPAPTGGPSSSGGNTPDDGQASSFDAVLREIQELRENLVKTEESFKSLRAHYQRDYSVIWEALQEEQRRCELLEEQLGDLRKLYENELSNLKEELAGMEDKIAYERSHESATDFREVLEACQMRLLKMEQQQQQQQQQHVQLESLDNSTLQIILEKLINVLLAVMAGLLTVMSAVTNCVVPLIRTSGRMFSTILFSVFFFFLWRHWDVISECLRLFITRTEKGPNQ